MVWLLVFVSESAHSLLEHLLILICRPLCFELWAVLLISVKPVGQAQFPAVQCSQTQSCSSLKTCLGSQDCFSTELKGIGCRSLVVWSSTESRLHNLQFFLPDLEPGVLPRCRRCKKSEAERQIVSTG